MAVARRSTVVPRHRRRRAAPWWSALRVRDWRVRTKLGAVLVVPALAFLVVAGLQTSASVRQAAELSELADQVALGQQVAALVHELQFERDLVGGELAGLAAGSAGSGERDRLRERLSEPRAAVAQARSEFDAAAAPLRDRPGLRTAIADATAALDELAVVQGGTVAGWLTQQAVFDGYTRAIESLLAILPAPSAADDVAVRPYLDLAEAKEISAQIRGHVFAIASAGTATPRATQQLADARAQRRAAQDRFRLGASAPQLAQFDDVVRGQAVRGSDRMEQAVLEQAGAGGQVGVGEVDLDPDQWWSAATTELELIREVESELLAQAGARAAQGSRDQWRQTAVVTGATLLILLVALLTSVGIGRSMARSLRGLRGQAMDVAHSQLPHLLARLRGAKGVVPAVDEVPQVAAGSADEVGDVADAFTQVHRSAVGLAVEQAVMRRNVNSIFVNLARRSQVLVERQLELLDDLEHDEAEPAQLRNLFRLDHLATRMRRNNESLLVLTDSDTSRSYSRPVPLAAVTVAAIAEIEQYQRVREDVATDLHVVGPVVADLVHLLAELLDNATAFSARDTSVSVAGRKLPGLDGALVTVTDTGLGMSESALAEANALLAAPPVIDVAASERMGLVVVGHLAMRHGIQVRLVAETPGVRATVRLPATLLSAAPAGVEPLPIRLPAEAEAQAEAPDAEAGGRRAVRAEDVLAGTAPERESTWWTVPAEGSEQPATRSGSAADAATTLLAPAPEPVVAGTSANGLPIRVPLAQVPGGQQAQPTSIAGWHTGELDPDDVGSTLSSFYGGVRRAESESDDDWQAVGSELSAATGSSD